MKVHCAHTEMTDVLDLKPHPLNPNKHTDIQIKELAKIIEAHGWRWPIKVSKRSGFITGGHGRLMAAKLKGWTQVPVDRQDYLNEAEEYQDMVADNKIQELAETDMGMVYQDSLKIEGLDLQLLGIPDFKLPETLEPGCDEDEVPEKVDPKTKLGDLYQLGNHRLLCGDSTDILQVEKLMDGEKADMVFTDPPYDMETEGGGLYKQGKNPAMKKIRDLGIDNFDPAVLSLHCDTNIFFCNRPLIPKYLELAQKNKVSWDLAIYHKKSVMPTHSGHLMVDLEYILILGKQGPRNGVGLDHETYSKLYSGGKDSDNETSWSKPVALCEKFIKLYSSKSVLDIFGGSGSTLIACEKTNRKCFMMELDPHYCDVIVARWEKYTGKKAEILNG